MKSLLMNRCMLTWTNIKEIHALAKLLRCTGGADERGAEFLLCWRFPDADAASYVVVVVTFRFQVVKCTPRALQKVRTSVGLHLSVHTNTNQMLQTSQATCLRN